MSNDSFKPEVVAPQQRRLWGVIGGALFGLLALIAPYYLLEPFFSGLLRWLPGSFDLTLSIAQVGITGAALLIIAAALFAYRQKFTDIGLTKPTWQHVGKGVIGFVVYIVTTIAVAIIYHYLFRPPDQPQEIGYSATLGGLELVLAGIVLVVLVPLKEEIIFRGFMLTGFRRRLPFWVAATGVSAIFGLVHGQWNVGLDVFVMSMVSCYLVQKSGSLWPSICLHTIKNSVAFYLLYLYNGG